ncbi:MAG: CAP domain-containing protein [Rhizobiales bacterium]|nr:CAP domain-containing protein [Hyphomicrobiales bacterium]
MLIVVGLGIGLGACVGGGGGGPVSPVTMSPTASFGSLLNAHRSARGLSTLSRDQRLNQAASAHARDLARSNRLGHRGSDGSTHVVRAERTGYGPFVAENVAAGQKTPAAVMQAWLSSRGHRTNIELNPATHYGFAHAVAPQTKYKHFWVLVVGRPQGDATARVASGSDWVAQQLGSLGVLLDF